MEGENMETSYYCHSCSRNVEPNLVDFTCPFCHGGFIEEVEAAEQHEPNSMMDIFELINDFQMNDYDMDEGLFPSRRSNRHHAGRHSSTRTYRTNNAPFRFPTPISFLPFQEFFSNPQDYVFNQDSFDLIVTSIFNQSGGGPPPANEDRIKNLSHIIASDQVLEKSSSCSICFDDFEKGSTITQLPCQHCFHEECVSKWLKIHGTCPVCRKDLDGRDTSIDRNDDFINLIDSLTTMQTNPQTPRNNPTNLDETGSSSNPPPQ